MEPKKDDRKMHGGSANIFPLRSLGRGENLLCSMCADAYTHRTQDVNKQTKRGGEGFKGRQMGGGEGTEVGGGGY